MKIVTALVLIIVLFAGCAKRDGNISDAIDLRQQLMRGEGCSFRAAVTADYGNRVYTFIMDCTANAEGDMDFVLVSPETVSGICGTVSQAGGSLIFQDKVLLFEPLTQGQLTPAIGPWLMLHIIRGGYICSVTDSGTSKIFTYDDTYSGEKLQSDLTVGEGNIPSCCEIYWNNRRILTIQVTNFKDL